jgi:aliphatic sulfonates family ABC transporter substrate-binding protein
MTKLILPRRDFLMLTGGALAAAALPGVRAFAEMAVINFGYQTTSWGSLGMIAESQDLFKKAGANVKIFQFDSGKSARNAMIAGRVDAGIIGATPFIIGAAKGDMEAIGLALYGSKTLAVVAGAKSGIKTLKDLKGKKVGSQLGSATDFVFQNKILPAVGLKKGDVQIINVRFQNHVSALSAGSIDAFAGVEPFPSVAEVNGLGHVLTDYGKYDLQPIILAANTKTIKENRDNLVALMRGWLASVKLYEDHRDQATQIVLNFFKKKGFDVNEKIIKLMLSKIDVKPDFGPTLKSYLENQSKVLLSQKKIAAVPDWGKLLNSSILSAARAKA